MGRSASPSSDRAGSSDVLSAGTYKTLDPRTFVLPQELGSVRDAWHAEKNIRTIIHIQDAHCNYAAQQRIAEIVRYLGKEYGISSVNLEGGTKEYDLSIFTRIKDPVIREKVADYFVREGLVSGAESLAALDPAAVSLWGIEDPKLYMENLAVYRDSLKYKPETDRTLAELGRVLTAFKVAIYSKELIELDARYASYKAGNLPFKEYLIYLTGLAQTRKVPLERFADLAIMSRLFENEKAIDFRKANTERDTLIESIRKRLSRNALEELVAQSVLFQTGGISQKDFYAYLAAKAKAVGVDLTDFGEFGKYREYIDLYGTIDKERIMDEVDGLELAVKETLWRNGEERELDTLSRDLVLIKNIFNISLTLQDYRYYRAHLTAFDAANFTRFTEKYGPQYKITMALNGNLADLDRHRDEIEKFYEYSFKRDDAFLRNVRVTGQGARGKENSTAIIITGGFHTENLCEIFKKQGISYISIMPNFAMKDGYQCPYFSLLAGKSCQALENIKLAMGSNALAIASILTELGYDVYGKDSRIYYDVLARWREAAEQGKGIALRLGERGGIDAAGAVVSVSRGDIDRGRFVMVEGMPIANAPLLNPSIAVPIGQAIDLAKIAVALDTNAGLDRGIVEKANKAFITLPSHRLSALFHPDSESARGEVLAKIRSPGGWRADKWNDIKVRFLKDAAGNEVVAPDGKGGWNRVLMISHNRLLVDYGLFAYVAQEPVIPGISVMWVDTALYGNDELAKLLLSDDPVAASDSIIGPLYHGLPEAKKNEIGQARINRIFNRLYDAAHRHLREYKALRVNEQVTDKAAWEKTRTLPILTVLVNSDGKLAFAQPRMQKVQFRIDMHEWSSDDELAFVIAHESDHAWRDTAYDHDIPRLIIAAQIMADEGGINLMSWAGYRPEGALEAFEQWIEKDADFDTMPLEDAGEIHIRKAALKNELLRIREAEQGAPASSGTDRGSGATVARGTTLGVIGLFALYVGVPVFLVTGSIAVILMAYLWRAKKAARSAEARAPVTGVPDELTRADALAISTAEKMVALRSQGGLRRYAMVSVIMHVAVLALFWAANLVGIMGAPAKGVEDTPVASITFILQPPDVQEAEQPEARDTKTVSSITEAIGRAIPAGTDYDVARIGADAINHVLYESAGRQSEALDRAMVFVEDQKDRGQVLDDAALRDKLTPMNKITDGDFGRRQPYRQGYNFNAEQLAAFYTAAADKGIELNTAERSLRDDLVSRGVIASDGKGGYAAPATAAVISSSDDFSERAKRAIMDHELIHALYETDPQYRQQIHEAWERVGRENPALQEAFKKIMRYRDYSEEVVETEFAAYLTDPGLFWALLKELYEAAFVYDPSQSVTAEKKKLAREILASIVAENQNTILNSTYLSGQMQAGLAAAAQDLEAIQKAAWERNGITNGREDAPRDGQMLKPLFDFSGAIHVPQGPVIGSGVVMTSVRGFEGSREKLIELINGDAELDANGKEKARSAIEEFYAREGLDPGDICDLSLQPDGEMKMKFDRKAGETSLQEEAAKNLQAVTAFDVRQQLKAIKQALAMREWRVGESLDVQRKINLGGEEYVLSVSLGTMTSTGTAPQYSIFIMAHKPGSRGGAQDISGSFEGDKLAEGFDKAVAKLEGDAAYKGVSFVSEKEFRTFTLNDRFDEIRRVMDEYTKIGSPVDMVKTFTLAGEEYQLHFRVSSRESLDGAAFDVRFAVEQDGKIVDGIGARIEGTDKTAALDEAITALRQEMERKGLAVPAAPIVAPGKGTLGFLRTLLIDRLGWNKALSENLLIPAIEETVMGLCLIYPGFAGLMMYAGVRALFTLIHVIQKTRAPPKEGETEGRFLTTKEKLLFPAGYSLASLVVASLASYALPVALVAPATILLASAIHAFGNWSIGHFKWQMGKGVVGGEDLAAPGVKSDAAIEKLLDRFLKRSEDIDDLVKALTRKNAAGQLREYFKRNPGAERRFVDSIYKNVGPDELTGDDDLMRNYIDLIFASLSDNGAKRFASNFLKVLVRSKSKDMDRAQIWMLEGVAALMTRARLTVPQELIERVDKIAIEQLTAPVEPQAREAWDYDIHMKEALLEAYKKWMLALAPREPMRRMSKNELVLTYLTRRASVADLMVKVQNFVRAYPDLGYVEIMDSMEPDLQGIDPRVLARVRAGVLRYCIDHQKVARVRAEAVRVKILNKGASYGLVSGSDIADTPEKEQFVQNLIGFIPASSFFMQISFEAASIDVGLDARTLAQCYGLEFGEGEGNEKMPPDKEQMNVSFSGFYDTSHHRRLIGGVNLSRMLTFQKIGGSAAQPRINSFGTQPHEEQHRFFHVYASDESRQILHDSPQRISELIGIINRRSGEERSKAIEEMVERLSLIFSLQFQDEMMALFTRNGESRIFNDAIDTWGWIEYYIESYAREDAWRLDKLKSKKLREEIMKRALDKSSDSFIRNRDRIARLIHAKARLIEAREGLIRGEGQGRAAEWAGAFFATVPAKRFGQLDALTEQLQNETGSVLKRKTARRPDAGWRARGGMAKMPGLRDEDEGAALRAREGEFLKAPDMSRSERGNLLDKLGVKDSFWKRLTMKGTRIKLADLGSGTDAYQFMSGGRLIIVLNDNAAYVARRASNLLWIRQEAIYHEYRESFWAGRLAKAGVQDAARWAHVMAAAEEAKRFKNNILHLTGEPEEDGVIVRHVYAIRQMAAQEGALAALEAEIRDAEWSRAGHMAFLEKTIAEAGGATTLTMDDVRTYEARFGEVVLGLVKKASEEAPKQEGAGQRRVSAKQELSDQLSSVSEWKSVEEMREKVKERQGKKMFEVSKELEAEEARGVDADILSRLVWVRKTPHMPQDGVILPQSLGLRRIGRETLHGCLNAIVSAHDAGDWSEMPYTLIIPFKADMMKKLESMLPGDTWMGGRFVMPQGSIVVYHPKLGISETDAENEYAKLVEKSGAKAVVNLYRKYRALYDAYGKRLADARAADELSQKVSGKAERDRIGMTAAEKVLNDFAEVIDLGAKNEIVEAGYFCLDNEANRWRDSLRYGHLSLDAAIGRLTDTVHRFAARNGKFWKYAHMDTWRLDYDQNTNYGSVDAEAGTAENVEWIDVSVDREKGAVSVSLKKFLTQTGARRAFVAAMIDRMASGVVIDHDLSALTEAEVEEAETEQEKFPVPRIYLKIIAMKLMKELAEKAPPGTELVKTLAGISECRALLSRLGAYDIESGVVTDTGRALEKDLLENGALYSAYTDDRLPVHISAVFAAPVNPVSAPARPAIASAPAVLDILTKSLTDAAGEGFQRARVMAYALKSDASAKKLTELMGHIGFLEGMIDEAKVKALLDSGADPSATAATLIRLADYIGGLKKNEARAAVFLFLMKELDLDRGLDTALLETIAVDFTEQGMHGIQYLLTVYTLDELPTYFIKLFQQFYNTTSFNMTGGHKDAVDGRQVLLDVVDALKYMRGHNVELKHISTVSALADVFARALAERDISHTADKSEAKNYAVPYVVTDEAMRRYHADKIKDMSIEEYVGLFGEGEDRLHVFSAIAESGELFDAMVDRGEIAPSVMAVPSLRRPGSREQSFATHMSLNFPALDQQIGFWAPLGAITENVPFQFFAYGQRIGRGVGNDWTVSGPSPVSLKLGVLLVPDTYTEKKANMNPDEKIREKGRALARLQAKGYRVYYYKPNGAGEYHLSDGAVQMLRAHAPFLKNAQGTVDEKIVSPPDRWPEVLLISGALAYARFVEDPAMHGRETRLEQRYGIGPGQKMRNMNYIQGQNNVRGEGIYYQVVPESAVVAEQPVLPVDGGQAKVVRANAAAAVSELAASRMNISSADVYIAMGALFDGRPIPDDFGEKYLTIRAACKGEFGSEQEKRDFFMEVASGLSSGSIATLTPAKGTAGKGGISALSPTWVGLAAVGAVLRAEPTLAIAGTALIAAVAITLAVLAVRHYRATALAAVPAPQVAAEPAPFIQPNDQLIDVDSGLVEMTIVALDPKGNEWQVKLPNRRTVKMSVAEIRGLVESGEWKIKRLPARDVERFWMSAQAVAKIFAENNRGWNVSVADLDSVIGLLGSRSAEPVSGPAPKKFNYIMQMTGKTAMSREEHLRYLEQVRSYLAGREGTLSARISRTLRNMGILLILTLTGCSQTTGTVGLRTLLASLPPAWITAAVVVAIVAAGVGYYLMVRTKAKPALTPTQLMQRQDELMAERREEELLARAQGLLDAGDVAGYNALILGSRRFEVLAGDESYSGNAESGYAGMNAVIAKKDGRDAVTGREVKAGQIIVEGIGNEKSIDVVRQDPGLYAEVAFHAWGGTSMMDDPGAFSGCIDLVYTYFDPAVSPAVRALVTEGALKRNAAILQENGGVPALSEGWVIYDVRDGRRMFVEKVDNGMATVLVFGGERKQVPVIDIEQETAAGKKIYVGARLLRDRRSNTLYKDRLVKRVAFALKVDRRGMEKAQRYLQALRDRNAGAEEKFEWRMARLFEDPFLSWGEMTDILARAIALLPRPGRASGAKGGDINIADFGLTAPTHALVNEAIKKAEKEGRLVKGEAIDGVQIWIVKGVDVLAVDEDGRKQRGHAGILRNAIYIAEGAFTPTLARHEAIELRLWQKKALELAGLDVKTDWNVLSDEARAQVRQDLRDWMVEHPDEAIYLEERFHMEADRAAPVGAGVDELSPDTAVVMEQGSYPDYAFMDRQRFEAIFKRVAGERQLSAAQEDELRRFGEALPELAAASRDLFLSPGGKQATRRYSHVFCRHAMQLASGVLSRHGIEHRGVMTTVGFGDTGTGAIFKATPFIEGLWRSDEDYYHFYVMARVAGEWFIIDLSAGQFLMHDTTPWKILGKNPEEKKWRRILREVSRADLGAFIVPLKDLGGEEARRYEQGKDLPWPYGTGMKFPTSAARPDQDPSPSFEDLLEFARPDWGAFKGMGGIAPSVDDLQNLDKRLSYTARYTRFMGRDPEHICMSLLPDFYADSAIRQLLFSILTKLSPEEIGILKGVAEKWPFKEDGMPSLLERARAAAGTGGIVSGIPAGARKNIVDIDEALTEVEGAELLRLAAGAPRQEVAPHPVALGNGESRPVGYTRITYTADDPVGRYLAGLNIAGAYSFYDTDTGKTYVFVQADQPDAAIALEHEELEIAWREWIKGFLKTAPPEDSAAKKMQGLLAKLAEDGEDPIDRASHILAWASQIAGHPEWATAEQCSFLKTQITTITDFAALDDIIAPPEGRTAHDALVAVFLPDHAERIGAFNRSVRDMAIDRKRDLPSTASTSSLARKGFMDIGKGYFFNDASKMLIRADISGGSVKIEEIISAMVDGTDPSNIISVDIYDDGSWKGAGLRLMRRSAEAVYYKNGMVSTYPRADGNVFSEKEMRSPAPMRDRMLASGLIEVVPGSGLFEIVLNDRMTIYILYRAEKIEFIGQQNNKIPLGDGLEITDVSPSSGAVQFKRGLFSYVVDSGGKVIDSSVDSFAEMPVELTNRQKYRLETSDGSGFVIGGDNADETIRRLRIVNGRSIEACQQAAKNGFGDDSFLAKDDDLREFLLRDNEFVHSWHFEGGRLTHQDLARPLFHALNVMNLTRSRKDIEFRYGGRIYKMEFSSTAWGTIGSPFGDQDIEGRTEYVITDAASGKSIRISEIIPYLIGRYGFYEGTVSYRVEPADIIEMFYPDAISVPHVGPVAELPALRAGAPIETGAADGDINIADFGLTAPAHALVNRAIKKAETEGRLVKGEVIDGVQIWIVKGVDVLAVDEDGRKQRGHAGILRNAIYIAEGAFTPTLARHEAIELRLWQKKALELAGLDAKTDWGALPDDARAQLRQGLRSWMSEHPDEAIYLEERFHMEANKTADVSAAAAELMPDTVVASEQGSYPSYAFMDKEAFEAMFARVSGGRALSADERSELERFTAALPELSAKARDLFLTAQGKSSTAYSEHVYCVLGMEWAADVLQRAGIAHSGVMTTDFFGTLGTGSIFKLRSFIADLWNTDDASYHYYVVARVAGEWFIVDLAAGQFLMNDAKTWEITMKSRGAVDKERKWRRLLREVSRSDLGAFIVPLKDLGGEEARRYEPGKDLPWPYGTGRNSSSAVRNRGQESSPSQEDLMALAGRRWDVLRDLGGVLPTQEKLGDVAKKISPRGPYTAVNDRELQVICMGLLPDFYANSAIRQVLLDILPKLTPEELEILRGLAEKWPFKEDAMPARLERARAEAFAPVAAAPVAPERASEAVEPTTPETGAAANQVAAVNAKRQPLGPAAGDVDALRALAAVERPDMQALVRASGEAIAKSVDGDKAKTPEVARLLLAVFDGITDTRQKNDLIMAVRTTVALEGLGDISPGHLNVVAQIAPIGQQAGSMRVTRRVEDKLVRHYNGALAKSIMGEGIADTDVDGLAEVISRTREAVERAATPDAARALLLIPHTMRGILEAAAVKAGAMKDGRLDTRMKVQYIDQGDMPDLVTQFELGLEVLEYVRSTDADPAALPSQRLLNLVAVMVDSTADPRAILQDLFKNILKIRRVDWHSLEEQRDAWKAVEQSL